MNKPRSGHSVVFLNNFIYAIGGVTDDGNFSQTCERWNMKNLFWENISSLNYSANNAAVCTFDKLYIYKFGGKMDDKQLN